MPRLRNLLPFLGVALLAIALASCGSDASSGDEDDGRDDRGAATSRAEVNSDDGDGAPVRGPGSPERLDTAMGGGTAISPAVAACLERAGYELAREPAEGAIATWRTDDSVVAIAPSSEQALTIADSIGTEPAPAFVDGRIVAAGPPATREAGVACLQPVVAQDT